MSASITSLVSDLAEEANALRALFNNVTVSTQTHAPWSVVWSHTHANTCALERGVERPTVCVSSFTSGAAISGKQMSIYASNPGSIVWRVGGVTAQQCT